MKNPKVEALKKRLIAKAIKHGFSENWGSREITKLWRELGDIPEIWELQAWASTFSLDDLPRK